METHTDLKELETVTAPRRKRSLLIVSSILIVLGVLITPPLVQWQQVGLQKTRSLSNLRRLADAWQMYVEDWDGYPVKPLEQRPDGHRYTWCQGLGGYGISEYLMENPANPTGFKRSDRYASPAASLGQHGQSPKRDPEFGFMVETSYALNHRFWDTFGRGPFPVENLELAEQTVLFVEAGPMSPDPLRAPRNRSESGDFASIVYGDIMDRKEGRFAYPSSHDGKLAVVAADGHAPAFRVEHYLPSDGPHDPLYGRIGGDIYNWNGGHPNGELDRPAHE